MPRTSSDFVPKYRKHKATTQALVTINGKDMYLGRYGSKESKSEYDRRIAEWLAAGRRLPGEEADLTFRRRVQELRAEMTSRALGRLTDAQAQAADVLRDLLDAAMPANIRLAAARSLLDMGARLRETVELEERLAALEQQLATKGGA